MESASELLVSGESTARVYHSGAHATSFLPSKNSPEQDLLFLSTKAILQEGKSIRGGIPLIFPQFGPGKLPQHGFARTSIWKKTSPPSPSPSSVEFVLESTPQTRALFPFSFLATYSLSISSHPSSSSSSSSVPSLTSTLKITNTGEEAFEFTSALHTYFNIGDISQTSIEGLHGTIFTDKVTPTQQPSKEERDVITISQEVDRIYHHTPNLVVVVDMANKRRIFLEKENLPDVVVWNPWIEKSKKMADFDPQEYKRMVCVEPGAIATPVHLQPNQTWVGRQTIWAEKINL